MGVKTCIGLAYRFAVEAFFAALLMATASFAVPKSAMKTIVGRAGLRAFASA